MAAAEVASAEVASAEVAMPAAGWSHCLQPLLHPWRAQTGHLRRQALAGTRPRICLLPGGNALLAALLAWTPYPIS